MKKLMAMIGAVAMSFGLFATGPESFSISFETAESEKGVSDGAFNPKADGVTGWTWAGDPFTLAQYAVGETLPYADSGDKARRNAMFTSNDNDNYLPLETGTDELVREVGTDNLCLDQLVKFTGFEDPQTNLVSGTKIAIWMSEFENEDESTTTNLYVTVGKVDALGNVEKIALPVAPIDGIDGYKLNTWYRLTVKSLGNIIAAGGSRAGFLIYINGQKVASSDSAATELVPENELTSVAYNCMTNKQLFTSIAANATFTSVGYQGIGAIDDIILDKEGPAFAVETVDVTFADVTGAEVSKVEDANGVVDQNQDGSYSVKPGDLTVTLVAAEGYKMKTGAGEYPVTVSGAGEYEITVGEDDFVEVYATKNGTDKYGADELLTMINGLVDGDVVVFNLDSTIGETVEEVEVTYYSFTAGSTITVSVANDVTTWAIVIAGENAWISDYVGTGADFIKSYTFTEEGGTLELAGDIAGALTAPNVEASIDIEVSGTLKAAALTIDSTIALAVGGKVMTADDSFDDTTITVPENYELDVQGPDEDDLFTYSAAQSGPEPTENVAKVGDTEYDNIDDAIAALNANGGEFVLLADNQTATTAFALANDATIDLGGFELVASNFVVNAGNVSITNGTIDHGTSNLWLNVNSGILTLAADATLVGKASANEAIAVNGGVFNIYGTINEDGNYAVKVLNGATVNCYDGCSITCPNANLKPYCSGGKCFINIYGGTFTTTGGGSYQGVIYGSKSGDTSEITINGGTFIAASDNEAAFAFKTAGYIIKGPNGVELDDSCTAKFNYNPMLALGHDENVLVPTLKVGYEFAKGDDDYYTIQAIPTYTVAAITVENASVVATNKTVGGATFALPAVLLRDTQIAVTVTPDTDYEYATPPAGWTKNGDGSITTNATVTADLAITVEAPTAAITPVKPGEPITGKTPEEVNANLDKYLEVPEIQGIDAATYRGMFAAKQSGDNVVIDLKPEVEEDIQDELDAATATVLAPDEDGKATITARIGLYYGIKAAGEVGLVDAEDVQNGVQATTTTLKITVPTADSTATPFTNKAFFKTVCSPAAFE